MAGFFQKPQSREWAGNGAYRVHQSFEAEGAAVGVWRDARCEQGLSCGGTHTAPKPGCRAANEHMVGVRRKREGGRGKRREGVAENREWLAMFQTIGVVAGSELREAREAIGDALDGAKPAGSRTNRR